MKTIRKFSRNPVVLLFVCSTILLFSCGKETLLINSNELSGRDIMRSIYFLDGPGTELMGPLRDLKLETLFNKEEVTLIRSHIDLFLDQIESTNPGVFESFKNDMQSGDHFLIRESLSKNATLIHETAKQVNNGDQLFSSLIANGQKPLAALSESYFPEESISDLSTSEIREVLQSGEFRNSVEEYFNGLEEKINGKTGRAEEQLCSIIFGSAVLAVAAIAVAVIYVVWVLNAVQLYNYWDVDWQENQESISSDSSLLKEQIVDAIAVNFNGN